ncbi:MAG: NADH-quinone oxidoreductase subunit D [Thermoplasmata archaeon]|nr:NADH-quinone oxidoreductase subunit D [Thermoplasmata archaeon]TFG69112.1 MAG: NADH-quinone oxidoreductase subunit D [Methanomassiliicoccus sp.]
MAEMWINMGPQHPMTHGLWNLRVKVDGETIVDAEPEVGYLHRGIEKICENRTYPQIIPLADRLCYGSSLTWSHLYCMTVEDLMGVEVPERAEYIRVVTLEMQRLASHLMWLAAYAVDLGMMAGFIYSMRDREVLVDLLQSLSGSRLTYNYPRIGGVAHDLPPNWDREALRACDYIETRLKEYEDLYEGSKIFMMRNVDVGLLSKEDALDLGVTGPPLRASGVKYDMRKDRPYSVYSDFDFEVCSRPEGDCFARYRVRIDEMWESCKIIRQAIQRMPKGKWRTVAPRNAPVGTGLGRVEDPRGEGMMYVVGDGSDKPYRLKIRSPIFITVSAAPCMLVGYKMADVVAIMGGLDMCIGECDR